MMTTINFHGVLVLGTLVLRCLANLSTASKNTHNQPNVECGPGWTSYRDEKCFKIIDNLVTHSNAEVACIDEIGDAYSSIAPLLTIKSVEEQNFLTQFLFEESAILESVWLDASRVNGTQSFKWNDDGTTFGFTHWREGYPSNIVEDECVQMTPKIAKTENQIEEEGDGFWTDISCLKRNLIVCQKTPAWSLQELQRAVFEIRKNPVPIGFLYVQLPDQPDAVSNWPGLGWQDVTAAYAGLFFRAEGGESAAFGQRQADQTRRITQVNFETQGNFSPGIPHTISLSERVAGWSNFVAAGFDPRNEFEEIWEKLRFYQNNVEVRPVNTAVRIWKRVY